MQLDRRSHVQILPLPHAEALSATNHNKNIDVFPGSAPHWTQGTCGYCNGKGKPTRSIHWSRLRANSYRYCICSLMLCYVRCTVAYPSTNTRNVE
ncbi:unnamed protein product, partial [Tuber melanosporum]